MDSHLSDVVDEFGETPIKAVTPARLLFEFEFSKPLVDEERIKLDY